MNSNSARQSAWSPPQELPTPPTKQEGAVEEDTATAGPMEDEEMDTAMVELLAAAECGMGCDWPEGPLSATGCRW